MGHLVAWQENALAVATELAVNETSATKARSDADWDARGDAINDEIDATWAALPMTEVRGAVRVDPRPAARLPDRRPRDALAQARRASDVLPRRDDGPLRGAPRRPRGDPGGRQAGDPARAAGTTRRPTSRAPSRSVGPRRLDTWSRGGRPFAIACRRRVVPPNSRLDPAVADAAARTPDVTLSSRGPGWVTFTPAELDDHAADRAVAWLASAHRRLGLQN